MARTPVFIATDLGSVNVRTGALLRVGLIAGFTENILDIAINPAPGLVITPGATAVHGLTPDNVYGEGRAAERDAAIAIAAWLASIEEPHLHGLHVNLHAGALAQLFDRNEVGPLLDYRDAVNIGSVYAYLVEAGLLQAAPPDTRLGLLEYLGDALGVKGVVRAPNRNALDDVKVTRRIWWKMLKLPEQWKGATT